MKRDLAEKLLSHYLNWGPAKKAEERRLLEALAAYKYDEYQQFKPGRRFVESLALWLRQFKSLTERETAYDFVKGRLIFVSEAEMVHLVQLAFPTIIRPHLMKLVAEENGIAPYRVKAICESQEFRHLLRRTLFLGLSDGARTDQLRRANPRTLSNEQIWHAYDVSEAKVSDLRSELRKDLGSQISEEECSFSTVVLLDDFTASGTSYIRKDDCTSKWSGKIPKVLERLEATENLGSLVARNNLKVIVLIYVASAQAVGHIQEMIREVPFSMGEIDFFVLYEIGEDVQLRSPGDDGILSVASDSHYYDSAVDDKHAAVGGTTYQMGYANCRLPVVLSHNTPNNSIYLLWAEEESRINGLFPRVSRHREYE